MESQMHVTPETTRDAYARALVRAAAAKLVAYRTTHEGVYEVPSISTGTMRTVRVTGRRWTDLSCDCPGGLHLACVHRAVVVFALKYGVWAKRPPVVIPDATDADVAQHEAIMAEVRAMAEAGTLPPAGTYTITDWSYTAAQAEAANRDARASHAFEPDSTRIASTLPADHWG